MSGSYRFRSGTSHDVTGPLALLAAQALQAATSGREAHITDSHGITVAITTNRGQVAVVAVGPIELFPQQPTTNPPAWATRLAGLVNQLQGEGQ